MDEPGTIKERQLDAGSMLFHEGDACDAVYILRQGEVEILRGSREETLCLSVLRKGAIFGEMGVLRDKPRSTSVRALTDCTMIMLSKADFLAAFGAGSSLALPLLRMLFERLSDASDVIFANQWDAETLALDAVARIQLLPASAEVAAQIGTEGIEITDLPYRIGRHAVRRHGTSAGDRGLLLRSGGDMQVSPEHLVLEARDGGLVLRDLGSHLGTTVNGIRIAHFEHTDQAALRLGNNEVHLGGLASAYRFRILVVAMEDAGSGSSKR